MKVHTIVFAVLIMLGVTSGTLITHFLIVPAMQNACLLGNCHTIKYTVNSDNGQVQVDVGNGMTYVYDGQFAYSYGVSLPMSCPSNVVSGTATVLPDTPPRPLCEQFDAEGICRNWMESSPVMEFSRDVLVQGKNTLQPVFMFNAYTQQPARQQVVCAPSQDVVTTSFEPFPQQTLRVYSAGNAPLSVQQIFDVLERRKVVVRPTENGEPDPCAPNGQYVVGLNTCMCDAGFFGAQCENKVV